ncbi:hypothetical protein GGS24DRAFT_376520 [Hypoxylon argillaceum]|nr:hypothetical protein GGS24DRAFT_376520 [Hypoxylon argillaceum]
MNFIRTSMLGRGRAQQGQDLERQIPIAAEEQTQNNSRLFAIPRSTLPSLFMGRLSSSARGPRRNEGESELDDGPKSPAPDRIRLPSLQYGPNQPSSEHEMQDSDVPSQSTSARVRTQTQRFPVLARPPTVRTNGGERERYVRRSIFNGSGPAELHLAGLVESEPRQPAHQRRDVSSRERRRPKREPPKNFLFCFPWVKSRRARALILRCFVSGIFLITMLTVYLSLSITKNINTSEFSILLIILILLTTVIFCHGLILLCMLLVRPRNRLGTSSNDVEGNKYGHSGYAIPRQPIRVVLARDEEAAGIESEATKLQPPAYGLWRESVRVDPNRIYWQRAESTSPSSPTSMSSTSSDSIAGDSPRNTQRRPPSYASDDGIEYVIDPRPRSIAPPPSIYSQRSTTGTQISSNITSMPPLPPLAVRRPGN